MKNKVVFIVGPTAVGKTSLALKLAKKFNGEIVSADSIQVYKGLDIISGKDLPNGYTLNAGYYSSNSGPSIYLLDVINPISSYDVSQFYNKAKSTINTIIKKGKLPVIVGGTGLYVEVLLNGLTKSAKPDLRLREKLNNLSIVDLQSMIPKRVLKSLNESDKNNKRRLIRRIESKDNNTNFLKTRSLYNQSLVIGLSCSRGNLRERINVRVEDRLKSGAIDEAKNLLNNYNKLTQQVKNANGYKQLFMFLKGEISFDEAIYRWKISEYKHAKNQMTWFKKYGGVQWFDISEKNFSKDIENSLKKFLS